MERWVGEPLFAIKFHSDIYVMNSKNYPVLPKLHAEVAKLMMKH